jgi:WD40 repeat protein
MNHIVVGGDHGQFLFIADRHAIERWDLASGTCQAVLASNLPMVNWMYGLFEVRGVAWAPDGKYAALSLNGSMPLLGTYDANTRKPMAILPPDPSEYAPNGDLLQFRGGEIYRVPADQFETAGP